jgi:hypothetical protein
LFYENLGFPDFQKPTEENIRVIPKSLNLNFPTREKKKLSTIELKNIIFSDFVKIFLNR